MFSTLLLIFKWIIFLLFKLSISVVIHSLIFLLSCWKVIIIVVFQIDLPLLKEFTAYSYSFYNTTTVDLVSMLLINPISFIDLLSLVNITTMDNTFVYTTNFTMNSIWFLIDSSFDLPDLNKLVTGQNSFIVAVIIFVGMWWFIQ